MKGGRPWKTPLRRAVGNRRERAVRRPESSPAGWRIAALLAIESIINRRARRWIIMNDNLALSFIMLFIGIVAFLVGRNPEKRARRRPARSRVARDGVVQIRAKWVKVEGGRTGTWEYIMALSIKDRKTELLARTLAERTGETITLATRRALEERLRRTVSDAHKAALLEDLEAIRRGRLAALPVLDDRSPDEIIGYDGNGIPS